MEDNTLRFIVHGRKKSNKFVLEGISSYILQIPESYNDKTIVVTFEKLVPTTQIVMNKGILIN